VLSFIAEAQAATDANYSKTEKKLVEVLKEIGYAFF
jgi:hypothetical protein